MGVEVNTPPVRLISELYDEALPVVYGYLRRRCGSQELAEDLTATAFVRAATACGRGTIEKASVGWVVTIARNLLIDHWRHQALAERSMELAMPTPSTVDPWSEVLDANRAEELLQSIKPEHRAALTLRYLDDLSVSEVAEALERSVHATESLLVRARAALRRAYESTEGGVP